MALCDTYDVKEYLGIAGTNPSAEDVIGRLCDAVTTLASTYCGRTLESTEHTEYKDGTGYDYIYLNNSPVTSISGIWEDTARVWDTSSELTSEYYFNDDDKVYKRSSYFTTYPKAIKVIYTAGYTTATIPYDLKQACIMEVVHLYKKATNGVDTNTRTTGDATIGYTLTSLQTSTKLVWDLYKARYIC